MTYAPDDEPHAAGYYSTISMPVVSGAMPTPPGPRTRLAARVAGALLLLVAALVVYLQVTEFRQHPLAFHTSPTYYVARWLGLLLAPTILVSVGLVLLRHGGDRPRTIYRSRRNRRS